MTTPPLHAAEREAATLPGIFHRYRSAISSALRRSLSRDDIAVYDMLKYHMGWTDIDGSPYSATEGKALRPTLCLFACEAVGGSMREAMPVAVALELIHNFALIHDDIQDRDEARHHRATLWAVWGVPKALVAGNALRVLADRSLGQFAEEGVDDGSALAAASVLTEAYREMIEGQYLDLSYEGRPGIGIQQYLEMISKKTGALIRSSLQLGALAGTQNATTISAFLASGRSLGYVFQIVDDVLGVWGDEDATGKPVGADIRRKKNSLPVVHAMAQARGEDRESLMQVFGKELPNDDDVTVVLEVMDRVNTKEYAHSLAADYSERALEAVAGVELAPYSRQELEDLVEFLLAREY